MPLSNPVTSAYIHIPFCKSKCKYCSFTSFENSDKQLGYLYSLLKEIDYYYNGTPIETLYLGGGTPSTLKLTDLSKILSKFSFTEEPEITIEVNPNDINQEYISGLKELGFNRISMGAQSFNDDILKLIGRRHCAKEIYQATELAQSSGFKNISLDLIYGLPTQTLKDFEHDLKEIINLGVQHLSLYGLKIDEGCYFYKNRPDNVPDDDTQADMFLMAGELTKENGYEHYEVSNYSKKGFRSKHNSNYWKCGQYYGFGVSAHGYADDIRYSNTTKLEEYLSNPTEREFGKFLTKQEQLEERIFLGLRLADGIDINRINNEFKIDFNSKYKKVLDKYLESGHLLQTDAGYRLSDSKTSNGFLLSNIILAEFLSD